MIAETWAIGTYLRVKPDFGKAKEKIVYSIKGINSKNNFFFYI